MGNITYHTIRYPTETTLISRRTGNVFERYRSWTDYLLAQNKPHEPYLVIEKSLNNLILYDVSAENITEKRAYSLSLVKISRDYYSDKELIYKEMAPSIPESPGEQYIDKPIIEAIEAINTNPEIATGGSCWGGHGTFSPFITFYTEPKNVEKYKSRLEAEAKRRGLPISVSLPGPRSISNFFTDFKPVKAYQEFVTVSFGDESKHERSKMQPDMADAYWSLFLAALKQD